MRLFLLTTLVMFAFAANSVLNRLALADHAIGPGSFAAIRLGSGALVLVGLILVRRQRLSLSGKSRVIGAGSLLLYMLGFSYAYLTLPAGVGALTLFGGVQVTMFSVALFRHEQIPPQRWLGAVIAFAGLLWLLLPLGQGTVALSGAVLMTAAAIGWGVYSLNGRHESDPLASTAANFVLAAPIAIAVMLLWPDVLNASPKGIVLATVSGAVTSGLGYALWYSVLPRLQASAAAVAQLTVPVIAFGGGSLLLGEPLTLRFALATCLVLGGVALSFARRRKPQTS